MKLYIVNYITFFIIILLIDKSNQLKKGGLKDMKKDTKVNLGDLSNIDIDKLSEKDLDLLLKDPKMMSSLKINPKAELKKPKSKENQHTALYKEHMDSLSKEGLNVEDSLSLDDESHTKSSDDKLEQESNIN